MKKVYSEFCSRHPKAVKLYKEVLGRDRRLQQFIRVRTWTRTSSWTPEVLLKLDVWL